MLGKSIAGGVATLAILAPMLMNAPAATALDASDIRLSALSVNQGTPLKVEVAYVYSASACTLSLTGPKKTKPIRAQVRGSSAKASIPTTGLPTGSYVVRVNCGKDGKASSSSFSVVPKGAPTTATCDVTNYGFSAAANGSTSYGVELSNRSPVLSATSVELSVAFIDGAGNTLRTEGVYAMSIPPGGSVIEGDSFRVSGVASIRIDALCDSSTEAIPPLLRGQATSITPRNSSIYPTEISGVIQNTTGFIISDFSRISFLTRNAAGAITGGGRTYPDAFIPVGATSPWSTTSEVFTSNVTSVDWVLRADEKS